MMFRRRKRRFPGEARFRSALKGGRDYSSPEHIKFRRAVLKRDRHTCQYPGCKKKKRLHIHHIRKWADQPMLRFQPRNGITLCKQHHDSIYSQEEYYVEIFYRIVIENEGTK